jgi:23S rRNA pseudouridine1911/1915/1917 synthase
MSNSPKSAPRVPLKVLYEDNHLLVIDKPAPLATMGAEAGQPSLADLAKDYLRVKYNKPGNVYVGVVSRLDAFVTGVIVLARTSKAAARLTDQFRRRSVEKTYWAMVADPLPDQAGTLEHYVFKNDARHRMEVAACRDQLPADAKLARLAYRVIASHQHRSLMEVKLETGRKHQIRVQFESIGCPILGDRKYGSEVAFKQGIALHARFLSIDHPTKQKRIEFESEPPSVWRIEKFRFCGDDS